MFASFRIFTAIWIRKILREIGDHFSSRIKTVVSLGMSFMFLMLMFAGFYRIIDYVKDTPLVGYALVGRLVGTVFLALYAMLIYSGIITAFSTLYFSRDNNFIIVSPFEWKGVMLGRLVQSAFYSSWMSYLVILPLLAALGIIFRLPVTFYLAAAPGLVFYFITAAAAGLLAVVGIVRIFPARKVRDLLIAGLVLLGTSLYVLFRMLNIEQILRPGQQSIAVSYLSILEVPRSRFLPSYWMTSMVNDFINGRHGWYIPLIVLIAAGTAASYLFVVIGNRYFYPGWEKVQSEEKKRYRSSRFSGDPLFAKDVRFFFRDTRQWTQLLLIFALIVVYVFNVYKLPLDIPYLHYLVTFLNIGMVGFVIAAVGLRFSFSSLSLEGGYFWAVLASPFDRKKILRQKYAENFIPVILLAGLLVVISNAILKPPAFLNLLSIITVLVSSVTLTSMGIGMGFVYPKFDAASPAEIETSWGGILYMIYSFIYIGITLALEGVWVRMYFMERVRNVPVYWPAVIGVIACLAALNIAANIVPLRKGYRSLLSIEFST